MSERVSTTSNSSSAVMGALLKAVKFIFISYIVSLFLIMALAVLVVYTDLPEGISDPAIKAIELFAAFLSALLFAKNVGGKGWLCGFLAGGANIIMLIFLGSLMLKTDPLSNLNASHIACGALCGTVGGIIGVNLGDKT